MQINTLWGAVSAQHKSGFTEPDGDNHLEDIRAVSWEQSPKVNSFFLNALCMKLSNLLCLSFSLQDDKRKVISLAFSVQRDTFTHQHCVNSLHLSKIKQTNSRFAIKGLLFYFLSKRHLRVYCRDRDNSCAVWNVGCLITLISHPTWCGYSYCAGTQNWDRHTLLEEKSKPRTTERAKVTIQSTFIKITYCLISHFYVRRLTSCTFLVCKIKKLQTWIIPVLTAVVIWHLRELKEPTGLYHRLWKRWMT